MAPGYRRSVSSLSSWCPRWPVWRGPLPTPCTSNYTGTENQRIVSAECRYLTQQKLPAAKKMMVSRPLSRPLLQPSLLQGQSKAWSGPLTSSHRDVQLVNLRCKGVGPLAEHLQTWSAASLVCASISPLRLLRLWSSSMDLVCFGVRWRVTWSCYCTFRRHHCLVIWCYLHWSLPW